MLVKLGRIFYFLTNNNFTKRLHINTLTHFIKNYISLNFDTLMKGIINTYVKSGHTSRSYRINSRKQLC